MATFPLELVLPEMSSTFWFSNTLQLNLFLLRNIILKTCSMAAFLVEMILVSLSSISLRI